MCESIGEHSKQNDSFNGLKDNKCIVGFSKTKLDSFKES